MPQGRRKGSASLASGGTRLERYRLLSGGLLLQFGDEEGRPKLARANSPEKAARPVCCEDLLEKPEASWQAKRL